MVKCHLQYLFSCRCYVIFLSISSPLHMHSAKVDWGKMKKSQLAQPEPLTSRRFLPVLNQMCEMLRNVQCLAWLLIFHPLFGVLFSLPVNMFTSLHSHALLPNQTLLVLQGTYPR